MIRRSTAVGLVIVVWIGLALTVPLVYAPPSPRGVDTPQDEFSAARALPILRELVGDGIPHPAGSEQNAVVRERILKFLRDSGYQPLVQTTIAAKYGQPVTLHNIMVRRRGSRPGRAVMLVAHYDSVPKGPGASDDGVGVAAILEIARMLSALPPRGNDVLFLLTDGEELGMLGAEGFVREHAWAQNAAVAINLEARGTSGPSLMFETGADSAWLVALYARHVRWPATSSLFYDVYKYLPNNTDFSVLKQHGIEGCNFAFIRNVRYYHQPGDNYDNADPGSLQHHGDNAWQMLAALADLDLDRHAVGRAIYTDLLGQCVIWWPAEFNTPLALAALIVTAIAGALVQLRRLARVTRLQTWIAFPAILIAALVVGGLCDVAFRSLGVSGKLSSDHPLPVVLTYWLLTALAVIALAQCARSGRMDAWTAWLAVWLWWNALGLAAALLSPGGSYLFILPGAIATMAGLLAALLPKQIVERAQAAAACIGAIVAGVLWLPVPLLIYDSLGLTVGIIYPICAAMLTLTAVPLPCGARSPRP